MKYFINKMFVKNCFKICSNSEMNMISFKLLFIQNQQLNAQQHNCTILHLFKLHSTNFKYVL
jgi:hypothetical protein